MIKSVIKIERGRAVCMVSRYDLENEEIWVGGPDAVFIAPDFNGDAAKDQTAVITLCRKIFPGATISVNQYDIPKEFRIINGFAIRGKSDIV